MDIIKRQNRKDEKSDFFFKLFDLLKSIYKDSTDISESEIELLAGDLGSSIESGYSIADINATVTNFWQILLWSREKRIAIVKPGGGGYDDLPDYSDGQRCGGYKGSHCKSSGQCVRCVRSCSD